MVHQVRFQDITSAWTWEGQDNQEWSTNRGSSKRAQSLPANNRPDPKEQGLRWKDLGPINLEESYLYPGKESDPPCPVDKKQTLSTQDQQPYMQWIETVLNLDRKVLQRSSSLLRIL